MEHGTDGRTDNLLGIERIYIHQVEILVNRVKRIQLFGYLKVMVTRVLCLGSHQSWQGHKNRQQNSFHVHLYFYCLQNYMFFG